MPPLKTTLALLSACGYFVARQKGLPLELVTALKATPILCLASFALDLGAKQKEMKTYSTRLAIGLVFCAVGDVLLELEARYPSFFIGGLGSFLIGHIFYVWAFKSQTKLALPPALIAYSFAAAIFLFLKPHIEADLVIPVGVYSMVIGSMGAFAGSRYLNGTTDEFSRLVGLLGALSFMLSDSLLAVDKFHTKIAAAKLGVMITYYLGQLGICMSASTTAKRNA